MRRFLALAMALVTFGAVAAAATAADPPPPTVTPFPAPQLGPVFVAAQTVDQTGAMQSQFAPGSTVVFRAYAVDSKTRKTVVAKDAKYFYVAIPNQPTVKLKYDPKAAGATGQLAWTGTWTVPTTYPLGVVPFKVLVKTQWKRTGMFVQMPVPTAMLTIAAKPQAALGAGPSAPTSVAAAASSTDVALYVDTVNGTQPVGAPKRPVGCTTSNVYKRGEQVVLRIWGFDLTEKAVLSTDNVDTATYSIPGQPEGKLNYGAHGAVGAKVWFWSSPWIVPAAFPLGDTTIHIVFKTDSGKTGTYDHVVTIIP
jgi:hypothetical protein